VFKRHLARPHVTALGGEVSPLVPSRHSHALSAGHRHLEHTICIRRCKQP
jgi:hypothetical protein